MIRTLCENFDETSAEMQVGFYTHITPERILDYDQGKQDMLDFIKKDVLYRDKSTVNEEVLRDTFANGIATVVGLDTDFDIKQVTIGQLLQGDITPETSRYLGAYDVINEVLNGELSDRYPIADIINKDSVSQYMDSIRSDIVDVKETEKRKGEQNFRQSIDYGHKFWYEGCLKSCQDLLDGKFNLPDSECIDRDAIGDRLSSHKHYGDRLDGDRLDGAISYEVAPTDTAAEFYNLGYVHVLEDINNMLQVVPEEAQVLTPEELLDLANALDKLSARETTQEL